MIYGRPHLRSLKFKQRRVNRPSAIPSPSLFERRVPLQAGGKALEEFGSGIVIESCVDQKWDLRSMNKRFRCRVVMATQRLPRFKVNTT
ncbi:hypothetical protein ANTQUA_LOCUS10267 [Anthophora quadrimaculata]